MRTGPAEPPSLLHRRGEGAQARPDAGGPPRFFALLSLPTGTVLAGTCGRGISRSLDGGRSWTAGEGGPGSATVNAFCSDANGAVLAATAATGLFRSADQGRTWLPVGLDGVTVFAVAVGRAPGTALVAGTEGLGVLRSADGGISWSEPAARPAGGLTVYRLLALPDGRMLAGTDGAGVWADDEETWRQVGLDASSVFALAGLGDGRVLAGTRGDGVHRSDDGGLTWRRLGAGLPDPVVHVLIVEGSGAVLAGTGRGIARSIDWGETWTPLGSELANHRIFSLTVTGDGGVLAGSYDGVWRWEPATGRWEVVDTGLSVGEAYAVSIDPATGGVVAGAGGGVFRSDDGDGWEQLGEGLKGLNVYALERDAGALLAATDDGVRRAGPEGRWEPAGLPGRRVFCLAKAGGLLLAGTLGGGAYRRVAPEADWEPANDGLTNELVYDLLASGRGDLFAATGAVVDGVKTGRIFRSSNGGRSWAPTEHPAITVYRLAESSSEMLFGGAQRSHILRSADGGGVWELLDTTGLTDTKTYCLAIDGEDRLYLGAGALLLRSTDAAETWTVVGEGLDGVTVYDLCAHPGGALLAATSSGLYRSADAGETWRPTAWPA